VKPWEVLERTVTTNGTELSLARHTSEYVIQVDGQHLMSSRMHSSEDQLAVLGCAQARTLPRPRVLVGGLGMGFTLRAALDCLPLSAHVLVAELVPAVVRWNRGALGPLAGHPLADPRVTVEEVDVGVALGSNPNTFDAVLLDVDNGPAALAAPSNAGLYDSAGVATAHRALKPGGVLAVWSAQEDRRFERRLLAGGFRVQREHVRGREKGRGPRHTILLARRP